MEALVVGGTGFLGAAIVDAALAAGLKVTVLSRNPNAQLTDNQVHLLVGDRYHSLENLDLSQFEVVFDTCAFEPTAVHSLINSLDLNKLQRYVFISSASVYGDYSIPLLSETAEVPRASERDLEHAKNLSTKERTSAASFGESYGPLKRECEILAESLLGDRATSLRAGLIVGAGDYTDRLTWWVRRVDLGGDIAAPKPASRPIQLIDVRDIAAYAVHCVTSSLSGIFNITSEPTSLEEILHRVIEISESDAHLHWISEKEFLDTDLKPWTDIPLYFPSEEPSLKYFFDIDVSKSLANGISFRTLDNTLENILNWDRKNRTRKLKCGIPNDTELMLLELASSKL
jgi:2'-hydroxyisoflavone reductase